MTAPAPVTRTSLFFCFADLLSEWLDPLQDAASAASGEEKQQTSKTAFNPDMSLGNSLEFHA